jgi:hypothetical protein
MDRKGRVSVLAGGVSIGSTKTTAGTLSGVFQDITDNTEVLVSNWHVFQGDLGKTAIVQPGPYDGGKDPHDRVGILKRYVPVMPSTLKAYICMIFGQLLRKWCSEEYRLIDAAVATFQPSSSDRCLAKGVYMEDGSIMLPKGTHPGDGVVGRKVWKCGRTTGYTEGVIVNDNATVKVWYNDEYVVFTDQIVVKGQSQGGDSGSPVFLMNGDQPSENDQLVGLLFAGSDEYFIVCKYKHLEGLLKVRWNP